MFTDAAMYYTHVHAYIYKGHNLTGNAMVNCTCKIQLTCYYTAVKHGLSRINRGTRLHSYYSTSCFLTCIYIVCKSQLRLPGSLY